MTKFYSSFMYLIGRILEKYYSFSLGKRILSLYLIILIPFLYFHEQHLPFWIILTLILFALVFALGLGLLSLGVFNFLSEREFQIESEFTFYLVNLALYFFLGLFSERAGILLFLFCFLIYLPFRIQKNRVFFRIFILGTLAFTNGILIFQTLRLGEWSLFHLQLKLNEAKLEIDLEDWQLQEKRLSHKDIPIVFHLSENMFFHKPSRTLGEYRSTGNLVGIVSNSDSDPNIYPYIKIYFVPRIQFLDLETLSLEFFKYLEFEKNQGDIEALENLGEHIFKERYKGRFWIFYDTLRPKNVKAGFYIIELKNGDSILLEIREKLLENEFHVPEIQEILDKMEIIK